MAQILLIVTFILLSILLFREMFPVWTNPSYRRAKGPKELPSHNKTYPAVSIHSYKDRCTAAEQLVGHRFLSSEAPRLPLRSCTSTKCDCVYMHHGDRRSGTYRRLNHDSVDEYISSPGDANRRIYIGRRAKDLPLV